MFGDIDFSILQGKILKKIEKCDNDTLLRFTTNNGEIYELFHFQDCCESVFIESIDGDLDSLLNSPILLAEMVSNQDGEPLSRWDESFTWTFYKLSTNKDSVTIRWYGSSNGYYSEEVNFRRIKWQN